MAWYEGPSLIEAFHTINKNAPKIYSKRCMKPLRILVKNNYKTTGKPERIILTGIVSTGFISSNCELNVGTII